MSGVIADAAAGVRADVWLWAARFFKTRALAKQAIETGKLGIDGQDVAKPSRLVRCGQRLRVERAGEVFEIEVWPLPQFQAIGPKDKVLAPPARAHLDALERLITAKAIADSQFKAILNEKDPPPGSLLVEAPPSCRGRVVSERVLELRGHPDFRIARRALIISRLAQVISERQVKGGLRRVMLTQAKRLQWLAARRYEATGGPTSVPREGDDEGED